MIILGCIFIHPTAVTSSVGSVCSTKEVLRRDITGKLKTKETVVNRSKSTEDFVVQKGMCLNIAIYPFLMSLTKTFKINETDCVVITL